MPSTSNTHELPPYFEAVYYSNFWYSRHYKVSPFDLGGNVVENDIERHKRELRILSIFFEQIYIPRGHLITYSFGGQQDIVDTILDSREFGFLHEQGVIRVSTLPNLDAHQDNERIISRGSETQAVQYPSEQDFLNKIPADKVIMVNSLNESRQNTFTFPAFGEVIRNHNPALAGIYLDILKEAHLRDIPFFHESFIRMLRERLPDNQFEMIWRATNSIYLTSGAPEHSNIIAYFNDEIEGLSYRFKKYNIDRYLFSFPSLYTFLGIFLGEANVSKLIDHDISETHRLIFASGFKSAVRSFRAEYQKLVWGLSSYTRIPPLSLQLDQRAIRSLFELSLDGAFRRGSASAIGVLDDVSKVAKGLDSGAGVISELLGAAARHSTGPMRSYLRRRRFPSIAGMMEEIETHLRNI